MRSSVEYDPEQRLHAQAAVRVSRKDNRSSWQPLPRRMQHGHPIHDLLSILATTYGDVPQT